MGTLSPDVKCFASDVLRAIGTPYALGLHMQIEAGEWDAIARRKVDPRAYTSAQEYFLDATAASLLRKYKGLPTSSDRVANAVSDWLSGERDCYRTNERLVPYLEGKTHPSWDQDVSRHIAGVRKKILSVLGYAPRYEELNPRHGPGATFSDRSTRATLADKMENNASLTTGAIWYLFDWIGTAWGREASRRNCDPVFVRGNRFSTAPKDATKDRPIGMEPSMNVFYQLALGEKIRRRLKSRAGIDLDCGQDLHRKLACEASRDGALATLDLKNASGTVAYNLVKLFLPPQWFTLLRELRSPFTLIDGSLLDPSKRPGTCHWKRLEQFSSMGNGYTFELETLIFWAITSHVCDECGSRARVLVFGDDILCDSTCVTAVTAALRFFGFTLNEEKSFASGEFRESCGGDFWNGRPVRPFFLKESLDEPHKLIAAANGIRRVGQDLYGSDNPLVRVHDAILRSLPLGVRRCRGPKDLGDIVIHSDEEDYGWTSSRRDHVWCYRPVSHRKVSLGSFSPGTVHALGLYGEEVSRGFINPRDSVVGYAVRKVQLYGIEWLPLTPIVDFTEPAPVRGDLRIGPSYDKATCRVVKRRVLSA